MTKTLISKSELANKAGVSRAAVTYAAKGKLAGAVHGSKIDLADPLVQEWIEKKLVKKTLKDTEMNQKQAVEAVKVAEQKAIEAEEALEIAARETVVFGGGDSGNRMAIDPEKVLRQMLSKTRNSQGALPDMPDVSVLVQMPLGEIISRFGTDIGLESYLKARKLIEEIKIKSIDAEAKRGDYIPRALVEKRIIPLIDVSFTRLVDDMPESMAGTVQTLVKNGSNRIELSEYIRKEISQILKSVKHSSVQLLAQ